MVCPLLWAAIKSGSLKPPYILSSVQTLWKIDSKNIILLFKYMSDVLAVLLQNVFETTSFTDAWRLRDSATPRCMSCLRLAQSLLLFKQTVSYLSYRAVFWCTAAVDFIHRPVQTMVLFNVLCRNSRCSRRKQNRVGDFRDVAPLYVIKLMWWRKRR